MFVKRPKNVYNIFKIKQILNTRRISMKKGTKKISFFECCNTGRNVCIQSVCCLQLPQKRICSQPKTDPIIPGNREMFFTQKLEQEILFFLFMTQIPLVHLLSGQKFQKDFKRNIRYIPWIFWAAVSPTNQGWVIPTICMSNWSLLYQRYYKIQNISCSFKPLLLICNYGKSTGCLHHWQNDFY